MAFVYILHSAVADKYYIGSTDGELIERIKKHNTNHKGFTGGKGDWKLKYSEQFTAIENAKKREKEIKNWKSRKMIHTLIERAASEHPD